MPDARTNEAMEAVRALKIQRRPSIPSVSLLSSQTKHGSLLPFSLERMQERPQPVLPQFALFDPESPITSFQEGEELMASSSLLSFLAFFEQNVSQTPFLELQQALTRTMLDTSQQQEQTTRLSRRQALITIATLTLPLLPPFQTRPSPSAMDAFLSSCSASLSACWHMSREFDIGPVHACLSHYLPPLVSIMRESRPHQKRAAHLAAQAALLQTIVGRHLMNFQVAEVSCKQAIVYSQIAEDPLLQVITLRHLAMIYYYTKRHTEELALYEQMKPFLALDDIPPIVQSFLYAGLAGVQALNQQQEAFASLDLARETFLSQPTSDPGPLYIDYDYSQVFLSEGLAYYDLGQYQKALETFLQVGYPSPQIPLAERGRLEFLNCQARTILRLPSRDRDMEQCIEYWSAALQGSLQLKSKQRYEEAAHIYELMAFVWPHERKIKALGELLIPIDQKRASI
jgi:tetratricopeptide (TPR) repeat protein